MSPNLRNLLAVVAGAVTNVVIVVSGEALTGRLFPFPPIAVSTPPAALDAALRTMPPAAFASVLAVTLVGALLSGVVAGRLAADPRRVGAIIAGLLLVTNAANAFSFWHPGWFQAAAVLLPAALGWLGARWGARATATDGVFTELR